MGSIEKSQAILLHLDGAYNLARWLMKNDQDAQDVVQDAFVRAFRFQGRIENVKTWFLATVRNTAYTALKKRPAGNSEDNGLALANLVDSKLNPELIALQKADLENVRSALQMLSEDHVEVFVLRELEELSYQEISEILEIPVGTVMSRLARTRSKMLESLRKIEGVQKGSKQ